MSWIYLIVLRFDNFTVYGVSIVLSETQVSHLMNNFLIHILMLLFFMSQSYETWYLGRDVFFPSSFPLCGICIDLLEEVGLMMILRMWGLLVCSWRGPEVPFFTRIFSAGMPGGGAPHTHLPLHSIRHGKGKPVNQPSGCRCSWIYSHLMYSWRQHFASCFSIVMNDSKRKLKSWFLKSCPQTSKVSQNQPLFQRLLSSSPFPTGIPQPDMTTVKNWTI